MAGSNRAYLPELVRAGVALLDRQRPLWWRRIDRERLQMGSCLRCVLGQLWGSYPFALKALGLDHEQAWRYGFNVPSGRDGAELNTLGQINRELARLWLEQIQGKLAEDERARRQSMLRERARQRTIEAEQEQEQRAHW